MCILFKLFEVYANFWEGLATLLTISALHLRFFYTKQSFSQPNARKNKLYINLAALRNPHADHIKVPVYCRH